MQIEPQTPLPAVYQIQDHTDPNRDSYYVRAVVRDSRTGDVIQTLNLVSESNGRYAKNFNAPVDGTGLGRPIDVTTAVYTDALYTTKSELYAEVLERWYVKSQSQNFGTSGTEVDYEFIRKMMEKVMADSKQEDAVEPVEPPEPVDFSPVLRAIARLETSISEIPEPPEQEKVELNPVLDAISKSQDALFAHIDAIEKPEPTDLSSVLEGIQNLADSIGRVGDLVENLPKKDIQQTIEKTLQKLYSENDARHAAVKKAMAALLGAEEPQPSAPATQPTTSFPKLFKP